MDLELQSCGFKVTEGYGGNGLPKGRSATQAATYQKSGAQTYRRDSECLTYTQTYIAGCC